MIGIFDSGFGGLQSLAYVRSLYPQYDYIFLADRKNYPYGTKTPEQIKSYTFAGLQRLFDQGAKIVIVACNTAAAYAIRPWQAQYPEKKALSVTIPGVEKVISNGYKSIGVLATQATVMSGVYNDLFNKFGGQKDATLHLTMAPELIDIVETGQHQSAEARTLISNYLKTFPSSMDCLVLGCTHFPALIPLIKELYSGDIVDPAREAAQVFGPYLEKHTEISDRLGHGGTVNLYTTGSAEHFQQTGIFFLPEADQVVSVVI